MTPYYADPLVSLYLGDCLEVLPTLEADSVDAVVTDPPAGISFMGKEWDDFRRSRNPADTGRDNVFGRVSRTSPEYGRRERTAFVEWMTVVMQECYRVVKPGGYAVVWSIPRTCHWTGWAIEDAGFRIVDQLAHVFASGFPKGKTQLKPAREDWWLARKPGPLRPLGIDECRIEWRDRLDAAAAAAAVGYAKSMEAGKSAERVSFPTNYVKPPYEPDKMSGRWPSNVLLSDPELFDEPNPWVMGSGATTTVPGNYTRSTDVENWGVTDKHMPGDAAGDLQPGYGDSGGYSRFFIVPKADRAERERGLGGRDERSVGTRDRKDRQWDIPGSHSTPRANHHPTVKPIDLMRHLVRLVTPPGGTCLDPFLGSGTTALAASEEGFRCIGIEREAEYLEIAKGRLMATPMGLGLDVPAPTRRLPKPSGGGTSQVVSLPDPAPGSTDEAA